MNAYTQIVAAKPDLSPHAIAERLASALRKAPKQPLPEGVTKPDSAWPAVYYRLVDGRAERVIERAHSLAHTLTMHNDEARYAFATHFAAWEPGGALRYNGPVLNALGRVGHG